MSKGTPLNWPVGSVRAILALLIVSAVVALALFGVQIPETLAAMAGAAVGYFFKRDEEHARSMKVEVVDAQVP